MPLKPKLFFFSVASLRPTRPGDVRGSGQAAVVQEENARSVGWVPKENARTFCRFPRETDTAPTTAARNKMYSILTMQGLE